VVGFLFECAIQTANNETTFAAPYKCCNNVRAWVMLAACTGAYTFMANVGKYDDKSADNFDKKVSALGVKYDLSKRTSLYARTAKMTYDNTTAAFDKKEVKFTGVGMMHNF
jgi:predicted porin